MSHDDYISDDDDDLGLSAMMAHAVTSSTSGGGREGRRGRDRDDEKRDRSRSRSSSIFRRNKKDGRDKKDCAPSTPSRRGRSRDSDLIDIGSDNDNDKNKNKRDVSRSRSRSVLRRMVGSGQKNTATTTTNTPIPATRSGEDDSVLTTGMNMTTTTKTKTTTTKNNTSNNNKIKVERKKSSSKKKHKKIKRSNNADANDDDNDDDDDEDTSSRLSSNSKKVTKNKKNKYSKEHHSNKTTSSRIEAIREPILTTEGAVIKDEMENLFPSPKSSEKKKVVMVVTPTTTTTGTGTPTETIVSSASIDLTPINDDDCDDRAAAKTTTTTTQHLSSIRSGLSVQRNSQKSNGSGSGSGAGSSNFGCGIMSNKAAQEQAEAALNRVAAHQEIENNNNSNNNSINSFGSSVGSGMDGVDITPPTFFNRRISNTNSGGTGSSRRNEQFQRLHRDSGLSSVDDDESCRSRSSRRSNISGNNMNNMIVSALHRQLDEHKVENVDLQKQLSEALKKIEQLNDELRIEKDHSKTTKDDLSSVQSKLGRTGKEKYFLIGCVRDMEDDFVAKDERIEKLQNVVETQLDTVEYLEEQLDKTEEEVLLMEDELNALILAVEKKEVVTEERVSERVSNNKGSHDSNKQGRLARVGSIREDMVIRKNSIKMQKAESRRLLFNESVITESSRRNRPSVVSSSGSHDVDERENQLQLRELKLEADRKECNIREERLDGLEKDLLETDNNNNNKIANEGGTSQAEHSERNNVVSELTVASCSLETENKELSQLIASLQKEKENLHAIQIEDSEKLKKLKAENEDLRVKFDHVRGTTSSQENLSEKSQNDECDEEGKDLLIRELQNQLVTSKLEAHQLSSGSYVTKLKFEIKTLKQNIRGLKNNVKKEECILKSQLKKKDDSIKLMEKQMQKLKIEIERREKRDKNLGTDQMLSDVALQHHIEDLEEEIFHWKSAHADLENQMETMKSKANEIDGISRDDANADGVEDDCSLGSLQSLNSQIEMPMNMSQDGLFFVSNSNSMSSISGIPPLQNEEPATPSKRAMRTVSSLWSKMTTGVEPTNSNPAIPYATGMLNDE